MAATPLTSRSLPARLVRAAILAGALAVSAPEATAQVCAGFSADTFVRHRALGGWDDRGGSYVVDFSIFALDPADWIAGQPTWCASDVTLHFAVPAPTAQLGIWFFQRSPVYDPGTPFSFAQTVLSGRGVTSNMSAVLLRVPDVLSDGLQIDESGTVFPGPSTPVGLSAVPEPATLALTAGGLLAIAAVARRRRA
jgi:hypothetical protein